MTEGRTPKLLATIVCTTVALLVPAIALSASQPVLGSRAFPGPYGKGFGTPHPKTIFNGGVPSGLVEDISWKQWGDAVAFGRGLGHQYKPRGGYYKRPVKVRLRAEKLGTCPGHKAPAYTRLKAKFQKRPGGAYGPWFLWSGADTICEPPFSG
jgi:hypothetical protein